MTRLRKVNVAPGIIWVEAAEADLRILCGCPADSVKHLMRCGLISETERESVVFENGPNAILLSDVSLQGGSFANLAEFPVLQMLYRQGMIIPGHPGNKGQRPLLIGTNNQLRSQLEYIHRGNYGLTSEQEIIETGITPELAREMMAIKLKFAFGKIAEPTDLLETCVLGDTITEIRGGVTIQRLKRNHFRFILGDEILEIDLNLKLGERYTSAYPMGFNDIDRQHFAILHSGDGDGWDINRPAMSSILMHQGRVYLIDAGPNLEAILNALGIGINEIEGIFQTHAHDDHFAGLTTLLQADRRIKFISAPMVRASVIKKFSALLDIDDTDFAHYFDPHDLVMDAWNDVLGLEVKPVYSPHPVETTTFVFRALGPDGYRTYAHYADIASFQILQGMANDPLPGLPDDLVERTRESYLAPANLKKLDIGGGLIHGMATDFIDDQSDKIVLSHIARPLTPEEKKIGSGAPFGTVDVLIPGYQEFMWRVAYIYLQAYFPETSHYHLQTLLSNPVVSFNPETILIREGSNFDDIFLVLAGNVEMIEAKTHATNILSVGAFIGELSGLHGQPSTGTYRASSFVRALRLPCTQYIEFVNQYGLLDEISRLMEARKFLQQTRLFSEALSYPTQNLIAKAMTLIELGKHPKLSDLPDDHIYLVHDAMIMRLNDDAEGEPLFSGDFFGEESALMGEERRFSLHAKEPAQAYSVPNSVFLHVPVVRWKLFEAYNRRRLKK